MFSWDSLSVDLPQPLTPLSAVTSLSLSHERSDVSVCLVLFCFKMTFLHVQQELDQSLPQRQLEDHRRVCTAVEHVQN